MRQIFKCEYCAFLGTEEEVIAHEKVCTSNYNRKSCYTCMHQKYKTGVGFSCAKDIQILDGKINEFCECYEREKASDTSLASLFGVLFGGD